MHFKAHVFNNNGMHDTACQHTFYSSNNAGQCVCFFTSIDMQCNACYNTWFYFLLLLSLKNAIRGRGVWWWMYHAKHEDISISHNCQSWWVDASSLGSCVHVSSKCVTSPRVYKCADIARISKYWAKQHISSHGAAVPVLVLSRCSLAHYGYVWWLTMARRNTLILYYTSVKFALSCLILVEYCGGQCCVVDWQSFVADHTWCLLHSSSKNSLPQFG